MQGNEDFIQNKVVPHFDVEDRIVFPILERLPNMDKMLIGSCRAEHEGILSRVDELKRILSQPLDLGRAVRVMLLVNQIVKDLDAHIARENEELIPAARRLITEEQANALDRVVRDMDKERT